MAIPWKVENDVKKIKLKVFTLIRTTKKKFLTV